MTNSVEVGLEKLREIHEVLNQVARDGSKFFDRGNKAAGVRARKLLQDLKLLAQELRIAIQRCKSENAQARLVDWGNTDSVHTPSHGLAVMNVDGLMAPALSPVPGMQTSAFTDDLLPAAGAVGMPQGIPSIQCEGEGTTQENGFSIHPASHPSL